MKTRSSLLKHDRSSHCLTIISWLLLGTVAVDALLIRFSGKPIKAIPATKIFANEFEKKRKRNHESEIMKAKTNDKHCTSTSTSSTCSSESDYSLFYVNKRPMSDKYEEQWWKKYNQLKSYYEKHGHSAIIPESRSSPCSLSMWVKTQRTLHRQNRLHPERVEKLNEIEFEWNPKRWKSRLTNGDDQWNAKLKELLHYKSQHGDYLVPQHYRGSSGNSTLGHWVDKQRQYYRLLQIQKNSTDTDNSTKISFSPLLLSRIQKLDAIGFQWSAKHKMNAPRDRLWYERRNDLMEYKQKHGNCLVPLRYKSNPKLGRWVSTQRQQYHLKKLQEEEGGVAEGKMKSMMTDARQKILEDLGFVWIVRTRRTRDA